MVEKPFWRNVTFSCDPWGSSIIGPFCSGPNCEEIDMFQLLSEKDGHRGVSWCVLGMMGVSCLDGWVGVFWWVGWFICAPPLMAWGAAWWHYLETATGWNRAHLPNYELNCGHCASSGFVGLSLFSVEGCIIMEPNDQKLAIINNRMQWLMCLDTFWFVHGSVQRLSLSEVWWTPKGSCQDLPKVVGGWYVKCICIYSWCTLSEEQHSQNWNFKVFVFVLKNNATLQHSFIMDLFSLNTL